MSSSTNIYELPEDLPIPVDDGACDHLTGFLLPDMALRSTAGTTVNLAKLGWDLIPGARGCTPQSCAFRDHYQELQGLHTDVYGLSTQDTAYQQEAAQRLHLPFPLLSDADLTFTKALRLPTFTVDSMTLIKRVTLIVGDGEIIKVFYLVFPPDQNAANVIDWLSRQQ